MRGSYQAKTGEPIFLPIAAMLFIELEDGDHHLSRYEHRLRMFEEMESFLATHLGTVAVDVTSNLQ